MNGQKKGSFSFGRIAEQLERYKYVLLVVLIGAALLLWPQEEHTAVSLDTVSGETKQDVFDLAQMERKMSAALSQIDGAGDVTVLLTVKNSSRNVLAEDKNATIQPDGREEKVETVVISSGSGIQAPVLLEQVYPAFQGALVICSGGDEASVHLKLMEAVSALTGLGADKICICKGK